MKKANVEIGKEYVVKVSGKLQIVKLISENERGGWNGINVTTKRSIRIKTAARLRRSADWFDDFTLAPGDGIAHIVNG